MPENEKTSPKLTGGILFNLLLDAKKPSINKSKKMDGSTDPVTAPYLISRLIKISFENHYDIALDSQTAKTNTTNYKSCEINGSEWLCFNNDDYLEQFNERFSNEYRNLLINTRDFINDCLDNNTYALKKLGRRILELIVLDESINDNEQLFINLDGSFIEKKQIKPDMIFTLQTLILGALYYINKNKILNVTGKNTFIEWSKQTGASTEHELNSSIGNGEYKNTSIHILPDSDIHFDVEYDYKTNIQGKDLNNYFDFSEY